MPEYYTPSIEEFHVGFEYEALQEKGGYSEMMPYCESEKDKWEWKSCVFGRNVRDNDDLKFDFGYQIHNSFYTRVKYLDKEDIESLGFTYEKTYAGLNEDFFEKLVLPNAYNKYFYLDYNYDKQYCRIYWSLDNDGDVTVFAGTIKNRSELKVLLKQLGIE